MSMVVNLKNQIKVSLLCIKYALMREMLNKITFLANIIFMVLNNATFIIEWIILYSLKENVGGYSFNQVLLLWGIASSTYGVSHFFFKKAFDLSDTINNGKLDSFIVQPKNILLSCIISDVETSALGDLLYGYIILFIYGFTIPRFLLYTFFIIIGGIILASIAVILGSLSFWFHKSDIIADTGNSIMTNTATYPDGIFKGIVKILLFTLIPVGIVNYLPVKIISEFNIKLLGVVIIFAIFIISFAFSIFYRGLKRYSSTNLMIAKI